MPSSVIDSFAYDEGSRRLTVRFVSGRIYIYEDVPAAVADAMTRAGSKGSFFNRMVRDRFSFVRG